MAKKPPLPDKVLKALEKIAFCGDGYHKVINLSMHTFPSGLLDPETAWKISWDDRCERCRLRMDASINAWRAGYKVGEKSGAGVARAERNY